MKFMWEVTQATKQVKVKSSGMERSPLQRDPLKAAGGGGQISDSLGDLDFIPETWDAIERH